MDDVSIRIERGEIYGLLGANGSGKSTFIRLVSGLLTLDEGRVEVFGHDLVREEMAVKRLINRVSVDAAFFKKLSPAENLSFAARLYGLDAREARRKAVGIMARLGIGEKRMGRPVEQMSRGMQQKVAIARAILTSPTLLLLDEPTTGLDPRSKLDVQTFIEELQADHDATIVLTTHDLAEADRLCGRIGILAGGRLAVEETPERPQDNGRPRARPAADARERLHEVHRPLPRRRRRGGRSRSGGLGGRPPTAGSDQTYERDTKLFSHSDRQAHPRGTAARDRAAPALPTRSAPGARRDFPFAGASDYGLIRLGSSLASDGPLQLAARR